MRCGSECSVIFQTIARAGSSLPRCGKLSSSEHANGRGHLSARRRLALASRVLSACICQAYIDDDISTARPDNFTVMSHVLQQRHRDIAQRRLKIYPQCTCDCLPPDATKTSANVNCRLVGRGLFLDPPIPPALAAAAASPCSQCTTLSSQP